MHKPILLRTTSKTGGALPPIDNRFIFTVKTDNAGTSGTNQFTIPTSTSGITQAFNYDIETSDGQTITGVTGNHTITFPSAGTYEVRISGSFPYMFFNNGGDRLKMLDISNFGIYALGATSQGDAFRGCSNMTITATDSGNFGSVTNFSAAWFNCLSLTSFPLIDTSSGINFNFTWRGCSSLTSFPLLDTSSGTAFRDAWFNCNSLTSFPALDMRNAGGGTNSLTSTWAGCSNIINFGAVNFSGGSNTGNLWFLNTWANCTSLISFPFLDLERLNPCTAAWSGCTGLQNFPANMFDNSSRTGSYTGAFTNTNLTTQSIDDILISLDTSGVINGTFLQSGGQAPSATGLTALGNLVAKGWTITVTA